MRTRALPLVIAISLATAPLTFHLPAAIAQGMDADTKEAKALFEDGVKLYKAGKFEEARVKFKAAYGLKKRPSIVLNLAHAELQTKRPIDAIAHFKEVIAMTDAKDDDKADAKQGLVDARKQVGVITVDAPTGTPITVDGESRTVPGDSTFEVMPGSHTVVLKTGGKDSVHTFELAAGQTYEVKAKGDAPPPAPTATTPPPEPTAPPTATTPPPEPTAPAPTVTAAPPPPPPAEAKRGFLTGVHPVTYVAAGVTVLATVGWIAWYASAQTHFDNVDAYATALERPTCGTAASAGRSCTSLAKKEEYKRLGKEENDAGETQRTLSIVSGVVAGVGLGATIATYILLRKKEPAPVAFIAVPTASGATFSLVGRF